MENNENKKSIKFQGEPLNFCDFIQVFVFTTNHHLNVYGKQLWSYRDGHRAHMLNIEFQCHFLALEKKN